MEENKQAEVQTAPTETVSKETETVINTIHTNPVDKLKEELKNAKNKGYAKLIIEHLIKRCGEDAGFGEDVLKKEKTFEGCFDYIRNQAKKSAVNGCAAIEDETVYEWAEDYYRSAQSTKSTTKKANKSTNKPTEKPNKSTEVVDKPTDQSTKENVQSVAEVSKSDANCTENEKNAQKTVANAQKTSKTVKKTSAKKNEPEGQMSIFDLMMGD